MKSPFLAFALVSGLGVRFFSPLQADVVAGDRHFEVLEVLGEPKGCAGSEAFKICYYDRGEVIFRGGVVESHTLVSVEEAERRAAAATHEKEARLQREKEAREARTAEGRAVLKEKIADPRFQALPAMSRLRFWQIFRQKYPEIDVDLEYSLAYQEASAERAEHRAEMERERRLHELELRVIEAEHQARRAEREAEIARRERAPRHYHDSFVHVQSRPTIVVGHFPEKKQHVKPTPPAPERSGADLRSVRRTRDIRDRLQEEAFMFPPLESKF